MAITKPQDGYNVVDEVPLKEWVNYPTEGFDEYVHIVVDQENAELRCYRTTNDGFPNERVKTTIEGVRSELRYADRDSEKALRGFYLTWRQADTFISFVEMMAHFHDPSKTIKLVWYENNEKPSHEDSKVKDETISLTLSKSDNQKRHIQIQDSWVSESNQMARYEEQ